MSDIKKPIMIENTAFVSNSMIAPQSFQFIIFLFFDNSSFIDFM